MILLLLLNLLSLAAEDSNDLLSTAAGEALQGRLVSVDENRLRWEGEQGPTTLDLAGVERIRLQSDNFAPAAEAPRFQVHLIDGSTIHGSNLATNGDEIEIEIASGPHTITVQRRNVFGIRFFEFATLTESQRLALDSDWQESQSDEITEDILTLRKLETDDEGNEVQSISTFEGVIEAIGDESVQFQFGGDTVPVKRERIAFVRFYHPAGRSLPEPNCLLQLLDGSSLHARSLTGTREAFQITTSAGVQFELPASTIREIDFAYGRVMYLDDLEPLTSEWQPFFRSSVSQEHLSELNRYRINQAFNGEPLSLFNRNLPISDTDRASNTQQYERGLALRSESRLIYSASQKYTRFVALAGIDPAVRPRGHLELTIRGDGNVLFQAQLTGNDPEPVPIDISIEGVNRLSVEVGFGEQLDIGDQLNLCRARLIK